MFTALALRNEQVKSRWMDAGHCATMLQRVCCCIARVASRQAIARPVAMRGCDNRSIAVQCVTAGALAPLHLQHNALIR